MVDPATAAPAVKKAGSKWLTLIGLAVVGIILLIIFGNNSKLKEARALIKEKKADYKEDKYAEKIKRQQARTETTEERQDNRQARYTKAQIRRYCRETCKSVRAGARRRKCRRDCRASMAYLLDPTQGPFNVEDDSE